MTRTSAGGRGRERETKAKEKAGLDQTDKRKIDSIEGR
jgi:hypothetical protein